MKNNPNNLFSLKDKVIIITGGAGLLGLSYAEILGKSGANVVLWDICDPLHMEKILKTLAKKGVIADAESVDITNENKIKDAVAHVLEKYKRIDGLINNAAMNPAVGSTDASSQFVPYEDYPIDLWEKELKVNLTGALICTKAVVKTMIKQKSGSIINIGSDVSIIAHDHRVYNDFSGTRFKSIAYSTTKTALVGFTRQWAARLGRYNIRVNTFSPTGIQTPAHSKDFAKRYGDTTMFGRMAKPEDYSGAIIFLCSDASAFMTAQNLIVDGGKTAW